MSELDDTAIRLALELQRVSAHEETRALSIIAELEADLRRLLAERDLTDTARRDVEALLKAAEKAIGGRYDDIAALIDSRALIETVARITHESLGIVSAGARPLTEHRIASLADTVLIDGSPASAWWERQAEDLSFRFAAQVRQGIAAGETQERIVARITGRPGEPGILETTRRATRALVHSSVMAAASHARLATFRANEKLFAGVKWLSTLDGHTCLQCAALDGAKWDLDGKPMGNSHFAFQAPPAHMRCLTGDTPVLAAGRITGVSKRWFDGEVVVIKTAAGRKFTCTPNHPVLTDGGWVAAGLLDIGSNIVCDGGRERKASGDGDGQNVPALIHEVAEAFFRSREMVAVPVPLSAEDFHGDGGGSEVAVIGTDRSLLDAVYSPLLEPYSEPLFVSGGTAGLVTLASDRELAKLLEADGASTRGRMGGGDLRPPLCGRHALPLEGLGLRWGPPLNPMLEQYPRNDIPADPEIDSDGILGQSSNVISADRSLIDGQRAGPDWYASLLQRIADCVVVDPGLAADLSGIEPGQIEFDAVLDLERISFAGHVYNLETTDGYYLADGAVVHNCRCTLTGIPRGLDEIFPGAGLDDLAASLSRRVSSSGSQGVRGAPQPGTTTFSDFLARQDRAFVERVLGVRRAELYRQGKLTLSDLVSGTGRPLTLQELAAQGVM